LLDDELKREIKKEIPKNVKSILISSAANQGIDDLKDMLWRMLTD